MRIQHQYENEENKQMNRKKAMVNGAHPDPETVTDAPSGGIAATDKISTELPELHETEETKRAQV